MKLLKPHITSNQHFNMGDKYTQRTTHGNRNAAQQLAGVKNVKEKKMMTLKIDMKTP